jgi:FixJ family two-component response regulator
MTIISRDTLGSAGVELETFALSTVLDRLRHELAPAARERRLELRVLPCSLSVRSDRRVLEDILRALLTHAINHAANHAQAECAQAGKIVLGCLRRPGTLQIAVLGAGPGTEYPELQTLLADIGPPTAPVPRGRESGLARAQRLGQVLGHKVGARLFPSVGRLLSVDVKLSAVDADRRADAESNDRRSTNRRHGPERSSFARMPDKREQAIGEQSRAVAIVPAASLRVTGSADSPTVYVVDDDANIRSAICTALSGNGWAIETFESCEAFLECYRPGRHACLTLDAYLPGMNGLELMQRLGDTDRLLPTIMLTGNGDVSMAVQAMKTGVLDFIQKPISRRRLVASVEMALKSGARESAPIQNATHVTAGSLASLTMRQRQIMTLILTGQPNKIIAATLGISQRTVESHRAQIMKKTGSKSIAALARLALTHTWHGAEGALEASQAAAKFARAINVDEAPRIPIAPQSRRP